MIYIYIECVWYCKVLPLSLLRRCCKIMMTNQLCVKLRNLLIVCGKYADQYTARIEWTNDSHYTLSLMPIASASDQFTAWQADYEKVSGKLLATHPLKKSAQGGLISTISTSKGTTCLPICPGQGFDSGDSKIQSFIKF